MKLTTRIRLNPTQDQSSSLLKTMNASNSLCNDISLYAFENKVFSRSNLQKAIYHEMRVETGLTAQIVLLMLFKVSDSYKKDKSLHSFQALGSTAYDPRILRWYTQKQYVSIWTVDGRLHIPYSAGEKQLELLKHQKGESDLVYDKVNKNFYLMATCDIEEPEVQETNEVIGLDMGIVNLVTTSDGTMYNGDQIEKTRRRYKRLRSALQSKGTKSAKRHLKKMSRKQSRFQKDTNHVISKKLVINAKDTNRRIHVENLTGISKRTTAWSKDSKARLGNWAFYQLQYFIAYKARMLGVKLEQVDSAYTSQRCNNCGHIDKANRPSQVKFLCTKCGHTDNADINAAKNIANWASVNKPIVANVLRVAKTGELQVSNAS